MIKLSPREISQQPFTGRVNGYDRVQVRAYLNDLAYSVEALLREQKQQQERIEQLQAELQEKRQAEDEIRRAIVSAERMAHELRENAGREAALLLEKARNEAAEAERKHQQRLGELDTAFRNRYAELERQFSSRYLELSGRLSAARQEYGQFLSTYRALLASFGELSLRHTLPEDVALPPLEHFGAMQEQGGSAAWMAPDVVQALPDLPPGLATALLGASGESLISETPSDLGPTKDARQIDVTRLLSKGMDLNTPDILEAVPGAVPVYGSGQTEAGETTSVALGRHAVPGPREPEGQRKGVTDE
ncbi:DivIVA domain-containing protein [Deinococcus sp. VB343]|uniref:DivIVA domain-containing protein n=1 Tax=Deinococcus sp. VB142 TaxID=3112952 RepID=A0AAU6Q2H8_9DEIO